LAKLYRVGAAAVENAHARGSSGCCQRFDDLDAGAGGGAGAVRARGGVAAALGQQRQVDAVGAEELERLR
jgi:hypothetical protein